ncbi:MAG: 6-pyruvoyl tetrahydrobiopterin synthase [Rothia sp. (in: high G+C Gram-positive bacteria)]|uniref:6-pyruvoyl tetrahydrobiopterin synthase n=1 Tax=Rothia sp. (in: high G+C Gram-positive bacteria) TaxID=1885016 RepID=UPI0026E0DE21|nr:6-pyruvoyl tetrahydrobiopterin synthase [Rothia sp. (in: high G+C Gram-positive bacteria)]MDO5751042.1 6-pyruvoyl tetrahydrobiopterin synthase [Rothia sp. (in: high G+C Gram-positive bacteria)]
MALIYNAQANPHIGSLGVATMHGDAQSSDATPLPGPGANRWNVSMTRLGGACPTILAGRDGLIQVLCTQVFAHGEFITPKISILDPNTGRELGHLDIPKGALLGGVYAYLDSRDRMVLVDGSNSLIYVAHSSDGKRLWVDERFDLSDFLTHNGSTDRVVGLVPDWQGRIWLATAGGQVAVVDRERGSIRSLRLNKVQTAGEKVDNSISACPQGVSIITSHAIYMLSASAAGTPQLRWFRAYDRGSARKPGKLAWGSGASPTFFGPNGDDYVMLTDNSDVQENVIVYRTADGARVGSAGLFTPGASGTENSMIGVGSMMIGASTYGYPYPKYPDGAGRSVPASALFAPGMERWDVTPSGLKQIWKRAEVYSSAVPRLSTTDGLIYTCERRRGPAGLADGAYVHAVALDAHTGRTVHEQKLPHHVNLVLGGGDTLQMVGTIDRNGTWWQGTISGVYRIAKA